MNLKCSTVLFSKLWQTWICATVTNRKWNQHHTDCKWQILQDPRKCVLCDSMLRWLIYLFNMNGIVYKEFVPSGRRWINSIILEALIRVLDCAKKNGVVITGSFIALTSASSWPWATRFFNTKSNVAIVSHRAYYSTLYHVTFVLFHLVEHDLKGKRFADVNNVTQKKSKSLEALKKNTLKNSSNFFRSRKKIIDKYIDPREE